MWRCDEERRAESKSEQGTEIQFQRKGMENDKELKQIDDSVMKVCKRCKEIYVPSSNTPSSCRFHPSFFVCRRHDDQKRYYELGPDDPPYAAKFYDCCGAEDPHATGCITASHVSYDDDD